MLDVMKKVIADLRKSGNLHTIKTDPHVVATLRKELHLTHDQPVVVDGVEIRPFDDPRNGDYMRAVVYMHLRWNKEIEVEEVAVALSSLTDEDLRDRKLVAIVLDQYADERGIEDPLDTHQLTEEDIDELKALLAEAGFEDVEI